jgi:hypothetical protein
MALPAGFARSPAPAAEYQAFEARKAVDEGSESGGKLSTEKIEIQLVEVKGELDRGAIEQVLRSRLGEVRGCCFKGAPRKDTKGEEIIYRLLVKADGKVAEVRRVTSTLADKARTDCLTKALRSLIFPRSKNGNAEVVIRVVCTVTS